MRATVLAAMGLALVATGMTTGAMAKEKKPKAIYARDSGQAATMELPEGQEHVEICVRQLLTNSRTRYRKVCMNQTAWKSYVDSMAQMTNDWKDSGKGLDLR